MKLAGDEYGSLQELGFAENKTKSLRIRLKKQTDFQSGDISKKAFKKNQHKRLKMLVELGGIEPPTSTLRVLRYWRSRHN